MSIRIYGKILETWTHEGDFIRNGIEYTRPVIVQEEIEYKEYDENGDLCGIGSEDFSPKRWSETVAKKWVYTWDGNKRNKGGYRWFENQGYIKFLKGQRKEVINYLKIKYPEAEIIELR